MKLKPVQKIIGAIQNILIVSMLFLTYIFGFGLTIAMIIFFNRRFFNRGGRRKDSFWVEARGYACDAAAVKRQS